MNNNLKISDNIDLHMLVEYDFEKIDSEQEKENENYVISGFEYKYCIGHSRRGQFYYILVHKSKSIHLFASRPDGDGGSIGCPDIFIKLMTENIITNN